MTNWDDLQRLTTDSLRMYEARRRVGQLSAEGERLLRQAEDLLRRAALAYLLEPLPPEPLPAPDAPPAAALAEKWDGFGVLWLEILLWKRQFTEFPNTLSTGWRFSPRKWRLPTRICCASSATRSKTASARGSLFWVRRLRASRVSS